MILKRGNGQSAILLFGRNLTVVPRRRFNRDPTPTPPRDRSALGSVAFSPGAGPLNMFVRRSSVGLAPIFGSVVNAGFPGGICTKLSRIAPL